MGFACCAMAAAVLFGAAPSANLILCSASLALSFKWRVESNRRALIDPLAGDVRTARHRAASAACACGSDDSARDQRAHKTS